MKFNVIYKTRYVKKNYLNIKKIKLNLISTQAFIFYCSIPIVLFFYKNFESINEQTKLVTLAVVILFLGVPHGSLDVVVAREIYFIRGMLGWLLFLLFYLILGILIIIYWKAFPILFLISFLTVSIIHFSRDLQPGAPSFIKILYGGAIIFLPTIFYKADVVRLFSFLIPMRGAIVIGDFLSFFSIFWSVGLFLSALLQIRKCWMTSLDILSVSILALFLSPLFSFTLFFCGMHSARHMIRIRTSALGMDSKFLDVLVLVLPMLGVLMIGGSLWQYLKDVPLTVRVTQLTFVGLAALTVPHMILLERFKFIIRRTRCGF